MHSEKKSYVTVGFQCWQRLGFNPSSEQSQRSDQTTRVFSNARFICPNTLLAQSFCQNGT